MNRNRNYGIAVAIIVICALWFVYGPDHWMSRVTFGTVTVDDRPVPAEIYIGQPTHSEAESIVLVHVPNVGNYFFSFEDEDYREASNREFVRLPNGVLTFSSMRAGHFKAPLPFRKVNEFRVVSHGHTVAVEF
jgi:hypothetical protein